MYDLTDIQAELENELSWRKNEMRFLSNQLANIQDEHDQDIYRKSLTVMLYSHYEGFCKTAFLIYITVINDEELCRKDAHDVIKALSMENVFQAYENRDLKNEVFKNTLPDDTKLHRFSRQVHFINEFRDFLDQRLEISDDVVDTESNLKTVVMKKLLYRLGFDPNALRQYYGTIDQLLRRRNSIAHGSEKRGISKSVYDQLLRDIYALMAGIISLIVDALANNKHLMSS